MNEILREVAPLHLPFEASIALPGSKSHANRAIICACLVDGETLIENATPCDDVTILVENIQKLGFDAQWIEKKKGTLKIHGGLQKLKTNKLKTKNVSAMILNCSNAGTTLRFLTALCCLVPGEWVVTGNERMQKRPIGELVRALKILGAEIEDTHRCPPVNIRGGTIKGGRTELDARKSSQFLSALLLIGPALPHGLTVDLPHKPASSSYIPLTKQVLKDFGVKTEETAKQYQIQPQHLTSPKKYIIEGDWSAAGAFLVLAELCGSRIDFPNLKPDSVQADRAITQALMALRKKGNLTIDCAEIPDQVINLVVLAAHRSGTMRITGAKNLRLKETDRLAVLSQELRKVGIEIEEHDNGLTINGKATLKAATLDPHDDHRMAMAFAILGCLHPGIRILDPACVSKSYPCFFDDLEKLRTSPRCIAIVGMRGCGKSNFGKKLAKKLRLAQIDTDAVFEKKYGSIQAFVMRRGWPAFRKEEEAIIQEVARPGYIVSLGGGAVESVVTRKFLKEHSLTLWMQASAKTLIERLRRGHRPALTELPLEQEVPRVLAKRTPLYRSVATITLPLRLPLSKQISFTVSALQHRCSW